MKLNLFGTLLTIATLVTALAPNFTQPKVRATEQKTPDVTLPSAQSGNEQKGLTKSSQQLVGKWSRLILMNIQYTFAFKPDGTFTMLKQSLFIGLGASEKYYSGAWTYSNGILLLRFSHGETIKGTISWISQNEFVYNSSSESLSARYSRVFD